MSAPTIRHWLIGGLSALLVGTVALRPLPASAQEEITRKVKTKTAPVYPDIAKRMSIGGTVKVMVIVAPNGAVKSTKLVGGHPLLANAALDAVKKWRFEPAAEETSGIVEFKFDPSIQQ